MSIVESPSAEEVATTAKSKLCRVIENLAGM